MGIAVETLKGPIRSATPRALSYRGPDRRRVALTTTPSRPFPIGVPILLVASHVVALVAAQPRGWSLAGEAGATQWLTASVAVVAALAGAMYVMRWRLAGDAGSLWIGTGLLVYSGVNVAFPGLVQSFSAGDEGAQSWAGVLRPASVLVVIGLLAMAAIGPTVNARLRPRGVAAFAGALAVAAIAATAVSDTVRLTFGPPLDRPPADSLGSFGQVGVALLWLALATVFIFPTSERRRAPWIGVMLLSLAEARLTLAASVNGDVGWMLASQVFRLFGVAAALGGAFHQLQQAFTVQRANLLASLVELGSAREARRAAEATAEERAHDLRSALAGIGGAAVTLERYHSRLSEDERASLAGAVAAEIARLQQIVSNVRPAPEPFEVRGVLEPVLRCAPADVELDVDIPESVRALARPGEVVEVVQNLIENAARHAPGSTVSVRARGRGPLLEVRVDDRGPGIRPQHRELVFERGWRGNTRATGSGLGLFNARRLARDQHGDLWVEPRTGGGSSFVLTLPAAPEGGSS